MKRIYIIIICTLLLCMDLIAQTYDSKMKAAILLNDCEYTLLRIEKCENRITLEEEQNKLNNEACWQDASKYSSIKQYRKSLNDELNKLIINDCEKERFRKAMDKKKKSEARSAIFNTLSGVHVTPNWMALVSDALISSARAIMDYGIKMDEYEDELDAKIWEIKKEEMKTIANERNNIFDVISELFNKEGVKDEMRMTESSISDFLEILEDEPELRVRNLEGQESEYSCFPPYWYEKGMAYIECYREEGEKDKTLLDKAWKSFDAYEKMVKACKLYKHDESLGMICLYKLKYKSGLSNDSKVKLIKDAVSNAVENGDVIVFCAWEYFKLGRYTDGFKLLSLNISKAKVSAKDDMLIAATANWGKLKDLETKRYFIKALCKPNITGIDFEYFLAFYAEVKKDKKFDSSELDKMLKGNELFSVDCATNDLFLNVQSSKFNVHLENWEVNFCNWFKEPFDSREEFEKRKQDKYELSSLCIELYSDGELFDSPEELIAKMPYFKRSKNNISSDDMAFIKQRIESVSVYNGKTSRNMFYWNKNNSFQGELEKFYYDKAKARAKNKGKIEGEKSDIRSDYNKFLRTYGVDPKQIVYKLGFPKNSKGFEYFSVDTPALFILVQIHSKQSPIEDIKLFYSQKLRNLDDLKVLVTNLNQFSEEELNGIVNSIDAAYDNCEIVFEISKVMFGETEIIIK